MNILLADDDKNFGSVLKRELEDDGHSVDLATDGIEAVLRFIDFAYDFILLDIKMPRLDGINALRIMKKMKPDVPAVTFSGNAGSGEMAESVKAGAIRCFTKPFEIVQLKNDIRRFTERRGGVRA